MMMHCLQHSPCDGLADLIYKSHGVYVRSPGVYRVDPIYLIHPPPSFLATSASTRHTTCNVGNTLARLFLCLLYAFQVVLLQPDRVLRYGCHLPLLTRSPFPG